MPRKLWRRVLNLAGDKSALYIMGDREPLARKLGDGPWEVKTARCSRCGACCRDCSESWPWLIEGTLICKYLGEEYLADLGVVARCCHPDQPWSCAKGHGESEACNVRYEV